MPTTRRHSLFNLASLPDMRFRRLKATYVTNLHPSYREPTRPYAGPRLAALFGLAALSIACGVACAPSPSTLCEQIAAGESAVIEALFGFLEEENVTPEQIEALTLQAIPTELQFVLDNRELFGVDEHPLRGIVLGTVIAPPASLDGCWARIETERLPGDGSFEWVVADYPLHEPIGFDGRLIYARFEGQDAILGRHRQWAGT